MVALDQENLQSILFDEFEGGALFVPLDILYKSGATWIHGILDCRKSFTSDSQVLSNVDKSTRLEECTRRGQGCRK